jgi:hypothetical protein
VHADVRKYLTLLLIGFLFNSWVGCGILKEKEPEPEIEVALHGPLQPEEAEDLLGEVGENWLYGEGFGATLLNVGAVVLFPPYGLYLLGNGLISVAGYEPLEVTKMLPKEQEKDYKAFYSEVISAPGRLSAIIADEEYRDKATVKARMKDFKERVKVSREQRLPKTLGEQRTDDEVLEEELDNSEVSLSQEEGTDGEDRTSDTSGDL